MHLLVVSHFWYLPNSATCFEIIVIFGWKTRFLGYRLVGFEDIKNRRLPKAAPYWAAYFTYQTLNTLINICGFKVMVCLKNCRFLIGLGRCHTDLWNQRGLKLEPLLTLVRSWGYDSSGNPMGEYLQNTQDERSHLNVWIDGSTGKKCGPR